MCGLAGVVFAQGDVPCRLGRALTRLRHRGPDGTHTWHDGQAWLGHTRLRILDVTTAADQPMLAAGERGVLVYNGEVYNYRDLKHGFGADWHPHSQSDTEVVLESLMRFGPDALSSFNGMWALALWLPEERRLLLARDRFGIKPLYYAFLTGGGVAFASEIPALLELRGQAPEPHQQSVEEFLLYAFAEPEEHSFYSGILKLPPGCFARVTPEAFRVQRYWDLHEELRRRGPSSDPVGEFRATFRSAVDLRLRSDVPLGTCLSGGLDSSSIVCAVHRTAKEGRVEPTLTYRAFSARHPGTSSDEGAFIDAVLAHTPFVGHDVVPSAESLVADLEALVARQAEPFGSLSIYAQWCVMRLAREHGITVLLDGQGADEVLAGYPYYAHYRLGDLASWGQARKAAALARALHRVQGRTWPPMLASMLAGLTPRSWKRSRLARPKRPGAGRFLAGEVGDNHRNDPSLPGVFPDRFTDALYASLTRQGLPSLLRYEDRNSMAFSIEARLPFLDWRLVSLGFSLDPDLKLRDGWTKWVLREAMADELPEAIRFRRDKKAFSTPQALWLKAPLRAWVKDLFSSRSFRERGLYDASRVAREYDAWVDGGEPIDTELWLILSTELWFQKCLDRHRPTR